MFIDSAISFDHPIFIAKGASQQGLIQQQSCLRTVQSDILLAQAILALSSLLFTAIEPDHQQSIRPGNADAGEGL